MNSYMHSKEPHEILPTKASDCYVVVGLYHVKSLRTGPKILVSHGEAIPLHAHLTTNNLVFAVLGVFIAVIVQFFFAGHWMVILSDRIFMASTHQQCSKQFRRTCKCPMFALFVWVNVQAFLLEINEILSFVDTL